LDHSFNLGIGSVFSECLMLKEKKIFFKQIVFFSYRSSVLFYI
jgi:hypothetical protein